MYVVCYVRPSVIRGPLRPIDITLARAIACAIFSNWPHETFAPGGWEERLSKEGSETGLGVQSSQRNRERPGYSLGDTIESSGSPHNMSCMTLVGASLSEPHIDEFHVRNLYIIIITSRKMFQHRWGDLCSLTASCSSLFRSKLAV